MAEDKGATPENAAGVTLAAMEEMAKSGMHGNLCEVVFRKYDEDKDGAVSQAELNKLCMEMGARLSEDELKIALKVLDTNGDGKIEFDEFKVWWESQDRFERLRRNEAELAFLNGVLTSFMSFDTNKDGLIDREEFKNVYQVLSQSGYPTHSEQEDWDAMDRDHNGIISYSEFVDWLILGAQQQPRPDASQ